MAGGVCLTWPYVRSVSCLDSDRHRADSILQANAAGRSVQSSIADSAFGCPSVPESRHSERATPAAIALQLAPERKRGIMIGQKSSSGRLGSVCRQDNGPPRIRSVIELY